MPMENTKGFLELTLGHQGHGHCLLCMHVGYACMYVCIFEKIGMVSKMPERILFLMALLSLLSI